MDPFTMPEPPSDDSNRPNGFYALVFLMMFSVLTQTVGGCIQSAKHDKKHEEIMGEIEKLKQSVSTRRP